MGRHTLEAVRVETRCPYCDQMQGVECEQLHDYDDIVRCWYCAQTYVVTFRVAIVASPAGIIGNKQAALEAVRDRQRRSPPGSSPPSAPDAGD